MGNNMVKYKLVDTLLYQTEEGAVEGKFIIGDDYYGQVEKLFLRFLTLLNKIFLIILEI